MGIVLAGAVLTGCAAAPGYYVDAFGQQYDASRVKCITAPVGYVVPDDIYMQKYGQPWGVRCTAGKVPAVVSHGPDGKPVDVPVIPVPPKEEIVDASIYANSTELGLPIGAAVVVKNKKGEVTVITASSEGGAGVNELKASDALKMSQNIMKQTQDSVQNQVDQDLANH
jgi:hypothetical protein